MIEVGEQSDQVENRESKLTSSSVNSSLGSEIWGLGGGFVHNDTQITAAGPAPKYLFSYAR